MENVINQNINNNKIIVGLIEKAGDPFVTNTNINERVTSVFQEYVVAEAVREKDLFTVGYYIAMAAWIILSVAAGLFGLYAGWITIADMCSGPFGVFAMAILLPVIMGVPVCVVLLIVEVCFLINWAFITRKDPEYYSSQSNITISHVQKFLKNGNVDITLQSAFNLLKEIKERTRDENLKTKCKTLENELEPVRDQILNEKKITSQKWQNLMQLTE